MTIKKGVVLILNVHIICMIKPPCKTLIACLPHGDEVCGSFALVPLCLCPDLVKYNLEQVMYLSYYLSNLHYTCMDLGDLDAESGPRFSDAGGD